MGMRRMLFGESLFSLNMVFRMVIGPLERFMGLMGSAYGSIFEMIGGILLDICILKWGMVPRPGFGPDIWCGTCSLKDGFPELFRIARNKEALFRDHIRYQNGGVCFGDLNFTRHAQDWELEAVKSYYNLLLPTVGHLGPWKRIWKTGAPPRVAFFVWAAAALGRILTTDNLRRRHVIVLDWCCMCKESGESISHLLMHCSAAREVWLFIFNIFGIQWVMPSGVLDLLSCWGDSCHSVRIRKLWDMVPLCVFWCLWWERNARSFEGTERNLIEVKGMVLRTLMDWSKATRVVSFSSVFDFLDSCIA
uniref:Reverse transcriptase zinc-binding domain-containing protein n=1 Tax=Fagus sylvatica TaxID=28930 RepID=A0A2N9IT43_FAGSY